MKATAAQHFWVVGRYILPDEREFVVPILRYFSYILLVSIYHSHLFFNQSINQYLMGRGEGDSCTILLEGGEELAAGEEAVPLLPGLHGLGEALPTGHLHQHLGYSSNNNNKSTLLDDSPIVL